MERDATIEAIFANMQQMHRMGTSKFHMLMGNQDISSSQMELLLTVKLLQPVSVKDIASHMRLTPGAVTQLIEGLVSKGYLDRQPDALDRRVTKVQLADDGKKKLKELWEKRTAMLRKIMQTLDTEELAVMLRVQGKIMQHMQECVTEIKSKG